MSDGGTLAIAVVGVGLSVASLAWQLSAHALTGGRAKVTMKVGAEGGAGLWRMVLPDKVSKHWLTNMKLRGFKAPVVRITVRNPGRLPITVQSCRLQSPYGTELNIDPSSQNPKLPRRLDGGEEETWSMSFDDAIRFVRMTNQVVDTSEGGRGLLEMLRSTRIRACVRLGNGRLKRSRESFSIGVNELWGKPPSAVDNGS